jgi:exodeoxyribonuclease VIII
MLVINDKWLAENHLSYSSLKEFRKSPKHFILYKTTKRAPCDAMTLGSVVDCILLTPDEFDKKFMIIPNLDRRTKDGKGKHAAFLSLAQQTGRLLVDAETMEKANKMCDAVREHPEASELIARKKAAQVRLKWVDKLTGLPMLGYVDLETEYKGKHAICDMKTAASGDPEEWKKQAAKLDYELQAGCYLEGYRRTRYMFPFYLYMVIESTEPYNVSVIECPQKYTDDARNAYHDTMKAFRICVDKQLFHMGYEFRHHISGLPHTVEVPGWKFNPYKGWGSDR